MPNINETTIGFIGYGNMAQAMANGLLLKKVIPPQHIYACAKNWETLCANTRPKGIIACKTVSETVDKASLLVIAVKPNIVEEVLTEVKDQLKNKIIVSVAAGFPFKKYEEIIPGTHHLSTIPNIPISVGQGILICENKHSLTKEEYQLVHRLFSHIALIESVEPDQLSIAGTLSGCGPAFISMFIEALGDAGVKHGLSRPQAYALAEKMVLGTGSMLLETGQHPAALKDAVCSPKGSTIRGVATLESKGLRAAVIEAIDSIEN